jgi:hypothetical protein
MTIDRTAIADELADQYKRWKRLIEGAIAEAALDPPDLRMNYGAASLCVGAVTKRWGNAVKRIEAIFGKDWLSSSSAAVRLDYLCVAYPNDPDFRWMADVLFMLGLPAGRIEREASGKDGVWNRRLRKTKLGQDEMEIAALANWLFDYKEADDRREQNRLHRPAKRGRDHATFPSSVVYLATDPSDGQLYRMARPSK